MTKLSLTLLPIMGSSRLKGGEAEASISSAAARKGTQEPKSTACLTPLWSPPQAGLMLPPHYPLANRVDFSWALRTQTAEILRASYFSSRYISPYPEALKPPWNIPDLTNPPIPLSFPLEPPRPCAQSPSHALPAGETVSPRPGGPLLTPRVPGLPGSHLLGLAAHLSGWAG